MKFRLMNFKNQLSYSFIVTNNNNTLRVTSKPTQIMYDKQQQKTTQGIALGRITRLFIWMLNACAFNYSLLRVPLMHVNSFFMSQLAYCLLQLLTSNVAPLHQTHSEYKLRFNVVARLDFIPS